MTRVTKKTMVYDYVMNCDGGVTAIEIANALNIDIHTVNGVLTKLRLDGKLVKKHGAMRRDANIWAPNGKFYLIGRNRNSRSV